MEPKEFLSRLHGDNRGWVEIRPIPNLSGRDRWWVKWGDFDTVAERLEELDGSSNIYFGVAPRLHHGHGSKDDCGPCRWVIADWDKAQLPDGITPDFAEEFVRGKTSLGGLPNPEMVLWSGGGIHAYWELTEELEPPEWERLHRALPILLGSDPTIKNIDRLMRLPEYTNPKHNALCEVVYEAGQKATRHSPNLFFRETNKVPEKEVREQSTYRIEEKYTEYRNNGMYSEACRLHGALGDMPELFLKTLIDINNTKCDPPLPHHEISAILDSVMRGRPLDTPDPGPGYGLSPLCHGNLNLNDQKITEMVTRSISEEVKYVRSGRENDGAWITWGQESRIWEQGYQDPIFSDALLRLEDELEDIGNWDMAKRAAQLQGIRSLSGLTKRAAGTRGDHQISQAQLDAEDWVLVTSCGTYIDLRKGQPIPTDRSLFFTRKTRATWRPDKKPDLWIKFLDRVMPDPHHQEYLGRVLFYCLTGGQGEKAFFISQGVGDNGKTVFWEVVQELMGPYAKKGNKKLICPTSGTEAAHDATLVACRGRRLAIYEEVKEQDSLSGDLLKELAGGNQWMAGRGVGESEQEFKFTAKQSIITNQFPAMRVEDPALLKRLIVIPWTETITREEIDPYMAKKIVQHDIDGVFNWILSHRESFMEHGLKPAPREFEDKKEEFIAQADPVVGIVRDRLEFREDGVVRTADLRSALNDYAPSFNFPETRSVPQFMERLAVWCRSFMDKDKRHIRADKLKTENAWVIRGVHLPFEGEAAV